MYKKIQFLKEVFLDFLFPESCGFCGKILRQDFTCQSEKKLLEYNCNGIQKNVKWIADGYKRSFLSVEKKPLRKFQYICEDCQTNLQKICQENVLRNENFYFDEQISAYAYEGRVRQKMVEFKFYHQKYLYKALAERLTFLISNALIQKKMSNFALIIPVPLSRKHYLERGYNQAELLARAIAQKTGKKLENKILFKNKNNRTQSGLNARERMENTKNVYEVRQGKKIRGKNILLVDDIYTTGATVDACSKVLKENGASKIIVATVAKVIKGEKGGTTNG